MDGVFAFKLNDDVRESFSGGSVVCSPVGHMLDVKATLDDNEGVIYTSDPTLIAALRAYPALQETEVPADSEGKLTLVAPPEVLVEGQATTQFPWVPQQPTNAPAVEAVPEVAAEHQTDPDDPTADPTGDAGSTGDAPSDEPSSQASSSSSPSRARSRTGQTPGDNQ